MPRFLLSLLFVVLLLGSCGVPSHRVRITGTLSHAGNATCYLYTEDGSLTGVDTIVLENGRFSVEYPLQEATIATLLFPNFSSRPLVLTPGEEVTVQGDAGSLQQVEVGGTEENEALTDFRRTALSKPLSDQRLAAAQFIGDHPASLASLALFYTYFVAGKGGDAATTARLLKILTPTLGRTTAFRHLAAPVEERLVTAVGKPLPAFTATNLEGKQVQSKDYAGKPLLLLCAASWNPDSRDYYRALRTLTRHPGENGLQCLLISFDTERPYIEQALEEDSLKVVPLFDGKGVFSPLHRQLGLRVVPTAFLINSKGIITQREVAAEQLVEAARKLR